MPGGAERSAVFTDLAWERTLHCSITTTRRVLWWVFFFFFLLIQFCKKSQMCILRIKSWCPCCLKEIAVSSDVWRREMIN